MESATCATCATSENEGRGNTKTLPTSRVQGRKWCFTLNNFSEEEYATMRQAFDNKNWMHIMGREMSSTGTPHIQGYIESKGAIRLDTLKAMMPRAHIEKAKGTTKQNIEYCSKEDKSAISNIVIEKTLDEIYCENMEEEFKDIIWRPWQQTILDLIKNKPDRRTVNWIYDADGNKGKSTLMRYLDWKHKTIVVNGKGADIFNGIKTYLDDIKEFPELIISDIPRTYETFISYGVLEKIKDGVLYSGKYEGGRVRLLPLHLIIFANFMPNMEAMTEDRWNIITLE